MRQTYEEMTRISKTTDGSDDGFIQCLKPGRVVHSTEEAIPQRQLPSTVEFEADIRGTEESCVS